VAIVIERHRPLPPARKGAEEIVPELAQMEVGDSIFIPNEAGSGNPPVSAISVGLYGIRTQKAFDARYEDDGLRVWREK